MVVFFVIGPVLSILVSSALGFTFGGGIVTVISVHPARRCTSPHRMLPVGLGDGVGDCYDAADLSQGSVFLFPLIFSLGDFF